VSLARSVKNITASRENKEMFREESGAFTTFFAIDGAGYVRIIQPEMKEMPAIPQLNL
jgi:hypothetical protein